MYIDMISRDVDKAFEQWTKDPLWKAYAKEGLSLEDKKKDFYFEHNYFRKELSKIGWKPGDKIPIDEFHRINFNWSYYDRIKAEENIPLDVFLECLAKKKNKPLDKLTTRDLRHGIGYLCERVVPLHVVMSYLPEEDTI